MDDINLDGVQDSDVLNVLEAVRDVKHYTAAAVVTRKNKGVKRKDKQGQAKELEEATEALGEAMRRLVASPYTRTSSRQPALTLNDSGVASLRVLWIRLQHAKSKTKEGTLSEDDEVQLEAAVQHAVTAIDPDHTFEEKNAEDEEALPTGMTS